MPEEATLCRMLVLFHALHDVPDELLLGKELRPQRSTPFLTEAVSESDNEGSDGNSSGDEGDRAASPIAVGDGDTGSAGRRIKRSERTRLRGAPRAFIADADGHRRRVDVDLAPAERQRRSPW